MELVGQIGKRSQSTLSGCSLQMEDPNVAPEPAPCQVCAAALLSPKKYQIHKIEDGYALGGKPFVLMQLPPGTEGHACHKCYQANMKARVRSRSMMQECLGSLTGTSAGASSSHSRHRTKRGDKFGCAPALLFSPQSPPMCFFSALLLEFGIITLLLVSFLRNRTSLA